MSTVHDVAAYVTSQFDAPISTMKLQKLVYFSQGWHLGLLEEPLFAEEFQAWRYGPVCRDLYRLHRREYSVTSWPRGNPAKLSESAKVIVDAVIKNYGGLSGLDLSELTHAPRTPWKNLRSSLGLSDSSVCDAVIPKPAIAEYFQKYFAES